MSESLYRSDDTEMVRDEQAGSETSTGIKAWPTKGIRECLEIVKVAMARHPQQYLKDGEWARACNLQGSNGPFGERVRSAVVWNLLEQKSPPRPRQTKLTGLGVQLQNFVDFPDKEMDVLPVFVTTCERVYRFGFEKGWQTNDQTAVQNDIAYYARLEQYGQVEDRAVYFREAIALWETARVGDVMGFHRMLLASPLPVPRVPPGRSERAVPRNATASAPPVASPAPAALVPSPVAPMVKPRPEPAPSRVYHFHFHLQLPTEPS